MHAVMKRLQAVAWLARPLALIASGVICVALGFTYVSLWIYRSGAFPEPFKFLLLQFLPLWARALLFLLIGLIAFFAGIWRLSGVVIIPLDGQPSTGDIVLGVQRDRALPRITVISGGAGMLVLASIGQRASSLVCITPIQDPVEYYYRASSLLSFEQVVFVAPTPRPVPVVVTLDNGEQYDIKHNISHDEQLADCHVEQIGLSGELPGVTSLTLDAVSRADVIVFGPGSLFESILPSLLLPEIRTALQQSKARTIYICSLMTEPGLTSGFGVADHIRQFALFAGFTPHYVLVNLDRIDPDVRRMYAAANQTPIFLTPEDYEETRVTTTSRETSGDIVLEGSVVIEADLASSVVQLTASLDNPGASRTVRVLRHDPEKLAAAITEVLRRG